METEIKEIRTGNIIKPNSFRTIIGNKTFKLEFGKYEEQVNAINILAEIEFADKDFVMFVKGLLYSMVEYDQKSDTKILEMLSKEIAKDNSKS